MGIRVLIATITKFLKKQEGYKSMSSMKPKKCWHDVTCDECKKVYSRITHLGGDNKVDEKDCNYCNQIKKQCYECFKNQCNE